MIGLAKRQSQRLHCTQMSPISKSSSKWSKAEELLPFTQMHPCEILFSERLLANVVKAIYQT